MKKLLVFDTETLDTEIVVNEVKKHTLFNAKYGYILNRIISILFFMSAFMGIVGIISTHKNEKDKLVKLTALYDLRQTEIEADELHYMIGYLYLQTENNKPNKDTVYNFIIDCNSWYPEYIMAQAIIESGCGSSDIGQNANNLFGMKYIDQSKQHRPTTQIPGVNYKGYGVYKNWELSVVDRILWELSRFKYIKPSEETYKNALYSYAEAEDYVTSVTNLANKYKNKK